MSNIASAFPYFGISVILIFIAVTAFVAIARYMLRRRKVGDELIELISQNQYEYTVLDVRSREKYLKSHVDTALNVPYPESKNYYPTENMCERIIIYGSNDYVARSTARALSRNGYFNITHLGTYKYWENLKKRSRFQK